MLMLWFLFVRWTNGLDFFFHHMGEKVVINDLCLSGAKSSCRDCQLEAGQTSTNSVYWQEFCFEMFESFSHYFATLIILMSHIIFTDYKNKALTDFHSIRRTYEPCNSPRSWISLLFCDIVLFPLLLFLFIYLFILW